MEEGGENNSGPLCYYAGQIDTMDIYMIAPITYTCRIVYRAHIIPRSDSHSRESFYNMARL